MKYVLESLLFPPGLNIVIALAGLALWPWRRRAAMMVLAADTVLLYVLSLPVTAWTLMSALQTSPPLNPLDLKNGAAQAIVVLGAGRYADAPEYGGDTVSPFELERLRYGVRLQRLSRLPLLLVGGKTETEEGRIPEARLMKEAAENDFAASAMWTEENSRTTAENAANAAALLRAHGIRRVYLVTHAWHMPRALWSFRHYDIEAVPAPTGFITRDAGNREFAWLPGSSALNNVRLALHEFTGLMWYRLALR